MDKVALLKMVEEKITLDINNLERLIAETRASNNETKSSMGDKFETTREMVQQEINNLQVQLNEKIKAKNSLKFINTNEHQIIGLGSLVETDKGMFYISISLGEIKLKTQKISVISTESPLAKILVGKKIKDEILLNSSKQIIQNIW